MIFVFTGHGFSDKNKKNYLAVNDTNIEYLSESGLSLFQVQQQQLRDSGARRSIMFIDACRDNPIEGRSVGNYGFNNFDDSQGLNILYSTAQGKVSYESPLLGHGVFTHFLLKGLQGEDKEAQRKGLIVFDDLANFVSRKVKKWSFNNLPNIQKPYRTGESSGQFLVGTIKKESEALEQAFLQLYSSKTQFVSVSPKLFKQFADKGNAVAMGQVALLYREGALDYKKNIDLAIIMAKKSINKGIEKKAIKENNQYAQYILGTLYLYGLGVDQDFDKATVFFKKSSSQGNLRAEISFDLLSLYSRSHIALIGLGRWDFRKLGFDENISTSLFWYTQTLKSYLYTKGEINRIFSLMEYRETVSEGIISLEKLSKQGNAIATARLAVHYYRGDAGTQKKPSLALKYSTMALKQGLKDLAKTESYAQWALGVFNLYGFAIKKNVKKSFALFQKSAEQGYAGSQAYLGLMYQYGLGVKKNEQEAISWYKKSAEQNYAPAEEYLGHIYRYGFAVKENYLKAFMWYQKAAKQGFASAQNGLGDIYYNGFGVEKDYLKAIEWYRKSAKQRYVFAEISMERMYKYGFGTTKNELEASKWRQKYKTNHGSSGFMHDNELKGDKGVFEFYRSAAETEPFAQVIFGNFYMEGEYVGKDYQEAAKWFLKAAVQKASIKESASNQLKWIAQAQTRLSQMYEVGNGVQKNSQESFSWLSKAANLGYLEAQNLLGVKYLMGRGTLKSYKKAFKWFQSAARKGHITAQNNLGFMYENGYGVEKDLKKAIKWYDKSAKKGEAYAQQSLGLMYEKGLGLVQDYGEALYWYEQAKLFGYKDIDKDIKRVLELIDNSNLKIDWLFSYKCNQDALKTYVIAMSANNDELKDVNTEAKLFADTIKYKYCLPLQNIILIKDASKRRFTNAIKTLAKHKQKKQVLIYFSGHGVRIPANNRAEEGDLYDEGILFSNNYKFRDDYFVSKLNKIETEKLITILDTSFSGGMTEISCSESGLTTCNNVLKGTILTSSRDDQVACKGFTDDLLNALKLSKEQTFESAFILVRKKANAKKRLCHETPQLFKHGKRVIF